MSIAPTRHLRRHAIYETMMAARRGDAVEETLARMIASRMVGEGVMPDQFGLGAERFTALLQYHFPRIPSDSVLVSGDPLDPQRLAEMAELRQLLLQHCSGEPALAAVMAELVVAGCMGRDHLWQDLGLWCRADLSRLMSDHFAPLAARNNRDMKWKKFLYKQLCETEGIYTCRAPSCEVCNDYARCFGPEE